MLSVFPVVATTGRSPPYSGKMAPNRRDTVPGLLWIEQIFFLIIDYYHLDRQPQFFFHRILKKRANRREYALYDTKIALVTLTGGRN